MYIVNLNKVSINRKISYYLIFSYLYYEENDNLISDDDYDKLCKNLFDNYAEVKKSDHPNKDLVDKFNLECGSGFGIAWTDRIKASSEHLRNSKVEIIF